MRDFCFLFLLFLHFEFSATWITFAFFFFLPHPVEMWVSFWSQALFTRGMLFPLMPVVGVCPVRFLCPSADLLSSCWVGCSGCKVSFLQTHCQCLSLRGFDAFTSNPFMLAFPFSHTFPCSSIFIVLFPPLVVSMFSMPRSLFHVDFLSLWRFHLLKAIFSSLLLFRATHSEQGRKCSLTCCT